jgi:hypothetical protein
LYSQVVFPPDYAACTVARPSPTTPSPFTIFIFDGDHGGNLRSFHCKPRHAVLIEPSLQCGSPENGNISACGRRLSVFSALNLPNPDHRDRLLNRESPPLAGISEVTQGHVSERRTAWLATQC